MNANVEKKSTDLRRIVAGVRLKPGRPHSKHPLKVCSKCGETKQHRKRNQNGVIVYLDASMRRWQGDLCGECSVSRRGKKLVGQSIRRASLYGDKARKCRTCEALMVNRYFSCSSCVPVLEDFGEGV